MSEFASWYLQIKAAHIGLVLASGALFAVRGALVLAGRGWAMAKPWRMTSYGIDTALLMAGVMLWAGLSLNPASSPWLGAKLVLLVLYIVLGSLALKRARSRRARIASFVGALAVYLFMVTVALAHHPAGLLHSWLTHGA
ncbi:MAG: SirB2 family protein [Rubrivivax sp.]|nr:SirB2 family protein [Rubrivivax sp.]